VIFSLNTIETRKGPFLVYQSLIEASAEVDRDQRCKCRAEVKQNKDCHVSIIHIEKQIIFYLRKCSFSGMIFTISRL